MSNTNAPTKPTLGDYVEVLPGSGPCAGLVGRVKAVLAPRDSEPERVRLTFQGGRKEVVPMSEVRKLD